MSQQPVSLNDAKSALKKVGCKLKSQLDGSWAILEAKGARVIVPDLVAVMEYCEKKSPDPVPQSIMVAPTNHPRPGVSVEMPTQEAPASAAANHAMPQTGPVARKPEISEEQQKAIASVNAMLRHIHDQHLVKGRNVLHSDLAALLEKHDCPQPMKEKARSYAEAKIQKDCLDGKLHRVAFRNQEGQADAMYFLAAYAPFFKA